MSEDDRDSDAADAAEQPERSRPGDFRAWLKAKSVPLLLISLLLLSGGAAAWLYFRTTGPTSKPTPASPTPLSVRLRTEPSPCCRTHPTRWTKTSPPPSPTCPGTFVVLQPVHRTDRGTGGQTEVAEDQRAGTGAAVQELHPDSAVVLVLVDQSTTSKDNPDPAMSSSSVLVSLTKVNGAWLITKFEPV